MKRCEWCNSIGSVTAVSGLNTDPKMPKAPHVQFLCRGCRGIKNKGRKMVKDELILEGDTIGGKRTGIIKLGYAMDGFHYYSGYFTIRPNNTPFPSDYSNYRLRSTTEQSALNKLIA